MGNFTINFERLFLLIEGLLNLSLFNLVYMFLILLIPLFDINVCVCSVHLRISQTPLAPGHVTYLSCFARLYRDSALPGYRRPCVPGSWRVRHVRVVCVRECLEGGPGASSCLCTASCDGTGPV